MRAALAAGLCRPPECGGSLSPWAPLIVPPELNERTVQILVDATTEINADYLRTHPDTPHIYEAGVWYEPEPPGQEQFLTIPWCLVRRDMGKGLDCDDLAPWLAALYRVRYLEQAGPLVTSRLCADGVRRYHVRVKRGRRGLDGQRLIEDPSLVLGMGKGRDTSLFVQKAWRGNPHAAGYWWETFIVDGERT